MSRPAEAMSAGLDLAALEPVTDAIESGAGLPEVVRAAARALDASLVLIDRSSAVLAVAARSPADEQSLMADAPGVTSLPLRVADMQVGTLRLRARSQPSPALLRLVATLIASEVERVRAPEHASRQAQTEFLHAVLAGEISERDDLIARAKELMIDLDSGASVIVARAHAHAPAEEGWRARVLAVVERGARTGVSRCVAASWERPELGGAEVAVLVPGGDEAVARRAADGVLRELEAGLPGYTFSVGRSRVATDPVDLPRAANEALLATNVAQGREARSLLAFEETGAYRLLLSSMSENPQELQRFFAETVEPLVAYDEQYDTELVHTVETYLEADGNVAGTAQRLFTHRHTVRYRLERVKELCGLDVSSTDGREKLSLGLKAMRVLGIAASGGPASEAGTGAGRVPRGRSGGG